MIANEKTNPDKANLTSRSEKKLQVLFTPPTDRHTDGITTWQRFKDVFGGANTRSNVGTCLVVFAVPLLIPGITLTVVAFDDETGFNKYGVLHVLGMGMLCIACLFIIVGILLNVTFRNEVSPEDALHAISTHENSGKDETKNQAPQTSSANAARLEDSIGDTGEAPKARSQVSFAIASDSNTQRENHIQSKSDMVGAFPPLTTIPNPRQRVSLVGVNSGYVSSSDDDSSEDTDNRSSGSYILPQESEVNVSSGILCGEEEEANNFVANQFHQVLHEQGKFRDTMCEQAAPRLGKIPRTASWSSKSSHESQISRAPNNFFQPREEVKRPNNLSIGTGNALRIARHKNITFGETDRVPLTALSQDSPSNMTSSPCKQNSPRSRLGAFSNASALASSLQMSNSDELLPKHLGDDNFGSNVSVFSHDEEGKEGRDHSLGPSQEGLGGSNSKFTFDLPQNHQDIGVTQQLGCVAMVDDNKEKFTAKSILKNPSSPLIITEESSGGHFQFHAKEQKEEFTNNPNVAEDQSILDMTMVRRKSSARRSKTRQAFSFPQRQDRSSSPSPLPSATRQSAPPSLPVFAQESV